VTPNALLARALRASVSFALLLALVCSVALPASVRAQATGGSFGGGDFSDPPSTGGGGSSSYGSGSSGWDPPPNAPSTGYSTGPSYSSSGGGNIGGGGLGAMCLCAGFLLLFIVIVLKKSSSSGTATTGGAANYVGATGGMFLSQITLGIDWRARRELQEQLARLAASGQTGTKEGRAMLLRETVLALRRAEIAWLYAAYKDSGPPLGGPQAQAAFQSAASEARARFRQEVVRNADGTLVQNPTPEMRASASEGQGTVVVSLIVVARRGLTTIANLEDAGQIRAALQERGALDADSLVALEVVWSPAAENDRMSSAELEQNYTELRLIDPRSIAGRLFCRYCNGPFAQELLNCPHCGAPAPKVEQGEAQGPGPARLGGG
jgi:uncharacterized membrane protein